MKKLLLLTIACFSQALLFAHVGIVYPVGGESFEGNETIKIEWNEIVKHADIIDWDLLISYDEGITWDTLMSGIHKDSLSYEWSVDNIETSTCRIRVIQDLVSRDYTGTSSNFTISSVLSTDEITVSSELRISPNPMVESTLLEFDNFNDDSFTLTILNMQGVEVRRIEKITSGFLLEKDELKSGVYFLLLSTLEGIRCRSRLLIE